MRTYLTVPLFAALVVALAAAEARAEQTIVFFRHGEKPSGGYGQLTCQGLNRALRLPDVLIAKFGKGTHFYAPNPSVKINDPVGGQYYVRPLATIEPMAIRSGVGVNTRYAYYDVAGLQKMLITSTKADSRIFVAWEHAYLVKAVQNIMNAYGGGPGRAELASRGCATPTPTGTRSGTGFRSTACWPPSVSTPTT